MKGTKKHSRRQEEKEINPKLKFPDGKINAAATVRVVAAASRFEWHEGTVNQFRRDFSLGQGKKGFECKKLIWALQVINRIWFPPRTKCLDANVYAVVDSLIWRFVAAGWLWEREMIFEIVVLSNVAATGN